MIRKIIQIFPDVYSHFHDRDADYQTVETAHYSLCNDGSIWLWDDSVRDWTLTEKFGPIPQDKIEQETSDEP